MLSFFNSAFEHLNFPDDADILKFSFWTFQCSRCCRVQTF